MKKLLVFLVVFGLILYSASPLLAGGADNKTNWSAEYIRTLNRNAATDAADIVMYNPAGTTKMDDGFFVNLSAQYLFKDYNNNINGTDYDQDEPSIIPGLFTVYKKERWAGFFGVSNVLGGGKVEFDNGNVTTRTAGLGIIQKGNAVLVPATAAAIASPLGPLFGGAAATDFAYTTIKSQQLAAEQATPGYTFGGSYKINDMFSVALAARYVDSKRDVSGKITVGATNPMPSGVVTATGGALNNPDRTALINYHEKAHGWGGVLGLNISPNDQLNIGIRYDTKINLDFDQSIEYDTVGLLPSLGVTNGGTRSRNLPAIFALGVSYQLNPKIRLETDLTFYLNKNAGITTGLGSETDVDNGFELGFCFEYAFTKTVKGSIGYLYTKTGVDTKDMTPELPELDSNTLGAGVVWEVVPNVDLNFSIGEVFYKSASFDSTTTGDSIEYDKNVIFLGFGVQYKFF